MLVFMAGIHKSVSYYQTGKALIRLFLQKQSDLGLHCLSRPFWQATSVKIFRKFLDKVNVLKCLTLFFYFSQIKCWFSWLEFTKCLSDYQTAKTLIRLLQKQSDLGLCCLSRSFGHATSVKKFTDTVIVLKCLALFFFYSQIKCWFSWVEFT